MVVFENKGVLVRCVFTFDFSLQTLMFHGSCPHLPATQSRLKHLLTGVGWSMVIRAWQQDPGCSTSQSSNHDRCHAMISTSRTEQRPVMCLQRWQVLALSSVGVWLSVAKAGSSCGTCRGQPYKTQCTQRQTCTITELKQGKYTDKCISNATESPTMHT